MVSGEKGRAYVILRVCHGANVFYNRRFGQDIIQACFLRKRSIWSTQVGMTNESHWFEFPPVAVSDFIPVRNELAHTDVI